jgi:hypothetical protein
MMPTWGIGRGGGGGGFPGFHQAPQRFEETYHCYSVAFADKPHLEVRFSIENTLLIFPSSPSGS